MSRRVKAKLLPMLWFVKAVGVNCLSRLPGHERIHFSLQKALGRHRLQADKMLGRALEHFRLLRHMGQDPRDKVFLEIGTGWFPFGAVLASLLGARSVATVDIHPWLRAENVRAIVLCLEKHLGEIARATGVDEESLQSRYKEMKHAISSVPRLREILQALDIEYRCPLDLTCTAWPGMDVDVVISSNVLEHVPPGALQRLHRNIAAALAPGGVCIYRFNPGDHFAALHGSSIHFLKYGERTWGLLDGRGLAYHNRLRTPEHAELLRDSGLEVALWAECVDAVALEQLRTQRIRPQKRFLDMDEESICAYYAWFVLAAGQGDPCAVQPRRVSWIDEIVDAPASIPPPVGDAVVTSMEPEASSSAVNARA